MNVQTLTSGERFVPPHIGTAIGTAEFGERTVVIALDNAREAAYFEGIYLKRGWRVLSARTPRQVLEIVRTESIDLLVTDRIPYVATIRMMRRSGHETAFHFVAPDVSFAGIAWNAGAEAVMVRTIRHDDFFSYDVVERPDA